MSKPRRKKIIWAIDPYGNAKVQASAASLAHSLSLHNDVEVVYVYGSSGFLLEKEQVAIRFTLPRVESQINKFLNELKFKPQKKPRILAHGSEYVRADVKTLVSYAKKVNADAILVSTNCKIGFVRQALGSFSETLILESAVPVMIVNPKANVRPKPGAILFPTDFSEPSWRAFQQVVSFAKSTKAKIKIFHQYPGDSQYIPDNVSYFKNDHWLDDKELQDNNYRKIRSDLSNWTHWAKRHDVDCDHTIQFGLENIAKATLKQTKKENVWMIAMATVTGPITATFVGSNARWVARSANCPVWVLYVENK